MTSFLLKQTFMPTFKTSKTPLGEDFFERYDYEAGQTWMTHVSQTYLIQGIKKQINKVIKAINHFYLSQITLQPKVLKEQVISFSGNVMNN